MEQIKFKIELGIITHDDVEEHPFVNISVNGYPKFGEILEKDKVVEFNVDLDENTENFLKIEYNNKDPKVDVVLGDDNKPVLDKRVEIKKIILNDIELDFFAFDQEDFLEFIPVDSDGKTTVGFEATKLSWNGCTTLKFTTPIYLWFIENL